jgi:flagellar biosynthesis/type III secretory pathway ATPase
MTVARRLRSFVATYEAKRDLISMGAYAKGSDKELDEALLRMPRIEAFLRQDSSERITPEAALAALTEAVK